MKNKIENAFNEFNELRFKDVVVDINKETAENMLRKIKEVV